MLRKLLLTLFLFFLIQIPAFGFDLQTCTINATSSPKECLYSGIGGMQCGVSPCSANERCVYSNMATCQNGNTVAVGRCEVTPDYPCQVSGVNNQCYINNSSSARNGTDGECGEYTCGEGSYCKILAGLNDSSTPVECFINSSICFDGTGEAGPASRGVGVCVEDSKCAEACNNDSDCASNEQCKSVPTYDAGGNILSYSKKCVLEGSCSLPSGSSYSCAVSPGTGCEEGQYCSDIQWSTTERCIDLDVNSSYPPSCFVNTSDQCGIKIDPNNAWTEAKYCKSGDTCAIYHESTGNLSKYSDVSNYPLSGTCIKCVASGGTCTGDTQLANGAIDDCCDPNMKCGADKKCHPIVQPSFCSGQIPNPGSICKANGSTEDYCDLCPASVNGVKSRVDSQTGDEYCVDMTYSEQAVTSTCSSDCGCPNGYNCNNGSCTAESLCVSPGNVCSTGGAPCCNPADVSYTCTYDSEARQNTCQSPECAQVEQTLQCTEATESCCPDNKPFCNNRTCGEVFECTSEGECCPGYGMVCDANKKCVPSTDGECETEDNVLPPAPGYLGPQIGIITEGQNQGLFSAIGAILYPAGIGIGLFFILRAGYIIMTSEGSPDEVKRGQEYLTSAVIGTLFIVLSGSILRIIINTLLG